MESSGNFGSKIYLEYFSINKTAYRERVRWYEDHFQELSMLDCGVKFEIDYDYVVCLFELGRYSRFLDKVDPVIEQCIMDNIFEINGENVYHVLLQKKAASLYNLRMYGKAEKVLQALLKLEPREEVNKVLYARCLRLHKHPIEEFAKSVSILLLLMGISFKTAEILVVQPFYYQYLEDFGQLVTFFFFTGTLGLVGMEVWFKIKYYRLLRSLKKGNNL